LRSKVLRCYFWTYWDC